MDGAHAPATIGFNFSGNTDIRHKARNCKGWINTLFTVREEGICAEQDRLRQGHGKLTIPAYAGQTQQSWQDAHVPDTQAFESQFTSK